MDSDPLNNAKTPKAWKPLYSKALTWLVMVVDCMRVYQWQTISPVYYTMCNCSSSKVNICAPFAGSQVLFFSESKCTDDCEKHFAWIYRNIGAYCCVLEYSKYYDSHSYWMFNNNNKQIEETKRFGKCSSNCVSFVYISLSRPWLNCQNLIIN